jgi:hypothetical protein
MQSRRSAAHPVALQSVRAPVRVSVQCTIERDSSPATGILTLAVPSGEPLWAGQLSGDRPGRNGRGSLGSAGLGAAAGRRP